MTRFLRSKAQRNALWLAAGGKCQMCGRDLPEDWHADHVTPYSISGYTNIFDMQALCPTCNLKKGKSMDLKDKLARAMELCDRIERYSSALIKPQIQTLRFLRGICNGLAGLGWPPLVNPGYLISEIVPGGGKSFCAVMTSSILVGSGFFDCSVWIPPRKNLIEQAKDDYTNTSVSMAHFNQRIPIFNPAGLATSAMPNTFAGIKEAKLRGRKAFLLSYQKLTQSPNMLLLLGQLCEKENVCLIFDEFQLLHDVRGNQDDDIDGPNSWWRPISSLVETCFRKTGFGGSYLAGKLSRNDNLKLPPIIPYRHGDASSGEDPKREYPMWDIQYTVAESQQDRVNIKVDNAIYKGEITFSVDSNPLEVESLGAMKKEKFYNDKVCAFVDNEDVWQTIWLDLLESLDFCNHSQGYHGLYIGLARSIQEAKKHADWLIDHRRNPLLIHSEQRESEKKGLDLLRRGRGEWDGIVCVGIGYIGLSIQKLTHMAYLTHIRSMEWFLQAVGRIWRFDRSPTAPSYDRQLAKIFAPNDPKMVSILTEVYQSQNPGVRDRDDGCWTLPPKVGPAGPGGPSPNFQGIYASIEGREFNSNGESCKDHDFVDFALRQQKLLNGLPYKVVDELKDISERWGREQKERGQ